MILKINYTCISIALVFTVSSTAINKSVHYQVTKQFFLYMYLWQFYNFISNGKLNQGGGRALKYWKVCSF